MSYFSDFSAARRYRYERAFEINGRGISYGELDGIADALANSLSRMCSEGGTVCVLTRSAYDAVRVYLACVRAGFDCVAADSRITERDACRLARMYRPAVAVLPSDSSEGVGRILASEGCKNAVITDGKMPERIFPAQFQLEQIIEENNYRVVSKKDTPPGKIIPFYGDFRVGELCGFENLARRTSVYCGFPVFESCGIQILDMLLGCGHRIAMPTELTKRAFKKDRVGAVVCPAYDFQIYSEICDGIITPITDGSKEYMCAGGGLLFAEKIGKEMSEITGEPTTCEYENGKIRIVVHAAPNAEKMPLQKQTALELLYPNICRKSFVFTGGGR